MSALLIGHIAAGGVAVVTGRVRWGQRQGRRVQGRSLNGENPMAPCELCGNAYDKSFELRDSNGVTHVFDSFECAIHVLAPTCDHCHCRIIGHGIEADGQFYCCAHCARHSGVVEAVDRVTTAVA